MIPSSRPRDLEYDHGFLSNVGCEYRQLFEQAIANTGRSDIYCLDEPVGRWAQGMMDTHFSVWVDHHRPDCSDFWDEVRRLRATPYWAAYISLASDDSYGRL